MSVNGIGNSSNYNATLYAELAQLNAQNGTTGAGASGTASARQGGQLNSALSQALSELGINTGSGGSDQVNSLVQSLAAALQTQSGASDPVAGTASGTGANTGQSSLESNLQNLIFQVRSNVANSLDSMFASVSGDGNDATDPFSTSSSGGTPSSPLAALQNSFDSLFSNQGLSSQGSSGNTPSLASFLQSTLNKVQGASSAGNLISTKA
ncbi:MAG TPA: hypothetical protein VF472_25200 [Burkholderiaceae bacterium]